MRYAAAVILIATPLAAVAQESAPSGSRVIVSKSEPQRCGPGTATAQYRPGTLSVAPLGQLQSAARLRAVYRTERGCPMPVVLEKGIGANPDKQLPLDPQPPALNPLDR